MPGQCGSHPVQVEMECQFQHGGAVYITGKGKVFQPAEEGLCAAKSNHMEHNDIYSLPKMREMQAC